MRKAPIKETAAMPAIPDEPTPQKLHRRRTEDELRKALTVLASKKALLRINSDDEHDVVLADAVTELLELRQITMDLMQQSRQAIEQATQRLKNMSIS